MDVGIDALGAIVASRINDEAVVGVHVSRLINRVVARAQTPGRIPAAVSAVAVRLMVVLRSWGQAKVHKVGDGRLPFAVVEWTHGVLS